MRIHKPQPSENQPKICPVCHQPESGDLIFTGEKCRLCYNAERLAYYYEHKKNGTTKPRPSTVKVTNGLIICKTCEDAKPIKEFYINKVKDGVTYYCGTCKECVREQAATKYQTKLIFTHDAIRFKNAVITYKDGSVRRFDHSGKQISII